MADLSNAWREPAKFEGTLRVLTTAERNNLPAPSTEIMIFNSTTAAIECYSTALGAWFSLPDSISLTEIGFLDGVTAGTIAASKAIVVDANKDAADARNFSATNLKAGKSGTAGTVDVFPATASKGKLAIVAADNAGNTTNTMTNAAQTTTATWTIPDTNGSDTFVMSTLAQTVAGAKTFTAAIAPTGGVAAAGGFATSPRNVHTGDIPARVSTDGTNATPVTTETYIAEVFVPANMSITGIAIFNGATVGTNAHALALANSSGAVVANTALAGTTTSGADAYQRIAFTAPYAAVGPATYYVLLQMNGTTDRYNAHPLGNFGASKKTGEVFGTFTTITPPTTFTADLGPIASLY